MIRILERFKGWLRNETMTKGASRGRVFTKKGVAPTSDPMLAKIEPKVELVGIKVIRKDGTVEEIQ